jgi:hypothetical protein
MQSPDDLPDPYLSAQSAKMILGPNVPPLYTADQMRAYRAEGVAQEQESCAKEAEHWQKIGRNPTHVCGQYIAAAIRARHTTS